MESRITYFVKGASRSLAGWDVEGEPGLGPPQVGDEFSFIFHQDTKTEDPAALRVRRFDVSSMAVTGGSEVEIRPGDILGGEVDQER